MVWLDPLGQVSYRAFVGRLVPTIAEAVDTPNVLSARLISKPPAWELEDWRTGSRERRERGLELFESHPILGVLDVQNFSLVNWFDHLARRGARRLADRSRSLPHPRQRTADGGDMVFTLGGVPYVRYVDDTRSFVHTPDRFLEDCGSSDPSAGRLRSRGPVASSHLLGGIGFGPRRIESAGFDPGCA